MADEQEESGRGRKGSLQTYHSSVLAHLPPVPSQALLSGTERRRLLALYPLDRRGVQVRPNNAVAPDTDSADCSARFDSRLNFFGEGSVREGPANERQLSEWQRRSTDATRPLLHRMSEIYTQMDKEAAGESTESREDEMKRTISVLGHALQLMFHMSSLLEDARKVLVKQNLQRAMQAEADATIGAPKKHASDLVRGDSLRSEGNGDVANKKGGYEAFRAIGSPKLVCAPMVDQSELAFRMMTRYAFGCLARFYHARL